MFAVINPDTGIVVGRYGERREAEEHIERVNEKYPGTPGYLVVVEESECPTCGQPVPARAR